MPKPRFSDPATDVVTLMFFPSNDTPQIVRFPDSSQALALLVRKRMHGRRPHQVSIELTLLRARA